MIKSSWKKLLCCLLLLPACSPNKEEQQRQVREQFLSIKPQLIKVAQTAADQKLIGESVCLEIGQEGKLYPAEDINLLPELRLWRFLETERIAIRQILKRQSIPQARFFITEAYRDNYSNGQYCFGRWAVVNIQHIIDGEPETKMGVEMRPYDIRLRLTKIKSNKWLESKVVAKNLVGPLKDLKRDIIIRAYLPKYKEQLPPKGSDSLQL